MNLRSIINPEDYGGLGHTSVPERCVYPSGLSWFHVLMVYGGHSSLRAQEGIAAGRSAQPCIHPQAAVEPADQKMSQPFFAERDKLQVKVRKNAQGLASANKGSPNRAGHSSPHSRSSGGKRVDRLAADKRRKSRASSPRTRRPVKEHQVESQVITDLYTKARGSQVSIMDIVLDSKLSPATPRDGVSPEDWMDNLEEHQRIALHDPSDEDMLREIISPWWHGIRQARKWRGTPVAPVDCSSRRIYRVSAERSTAAWDSSLDSEDSANTSGSYGTAY